MARSAGSSRTADVIIIGGGVIGCSIALRLAQSRFQVRVFDRGKLGGEASGAAAGMIAPQGEIAQPDEFFRLCAASRDLYSSFVAEIEELSGESVGYQRDGALLIAIEEQECNELEEIYRGQTRLGLAVERLTAKEVRERVPQVFPGIRCGLSIPGDHWVDNQRLTGALARASRRLGVTFHAYTAVTKLNLRNGRVETIEACPYSISAGRDSAPKGKTFVGGLFILAAGCWSPELLEPLGIRLRMQPCRGQMIEFDSPADFPMVVRAGKHYLVPRSGRRIVMGSTMEYVGYEKAVTGEGLRSILQGAGRMTPLLKDFRFRRAWAGLRPDTADHLPILGYGELQNLIFATGHFRNGILLAPVTAQLISELILTGTTSRPIDAYWAGRFAPRFESGSV